MPSNDLSAVLGTPELAPPPTAAPAPTAPSPSPPAQGDPAVWTVLGEAGQNPQGQLAVASTIHNRMKASGDATYGAVVTDPANGYEAWQDPSARTKTEQLYPVGSPAYNAAEATLQGLQSGKVQPLPYDSFYSPQGQAALGRKPPAFDNGSGTDIGGNRFFTGAYTPPPNQLAKMILTPEEQAALVAQGAPTRADVAEPGQGPSGQSTDLAGQALHFLDLHGIRDQSLPSGSPGQIPGANINPQYGATAPSEKGAWWINPQGQLQRTGDPIPDYIPVFRSNLAKEGGPTSQLVRGALQGVGMDTLASANRLTGGGLAASESYGQAFGGPAPLDLAQASEQGFQQQQNAYALQNVGSRLAQGGRFAGQAIPATASALAVPELAPEEAGVGALGAVRGIGSRLAANALRGVAAQAPSVGASQTPVGQQLATAAVAGAVAPEVLGKIGQAGSAIAGLGGAGRTVSPDIAQLADAAQSKYGIQLRSGQVVGADGDRAAAVADSNMVSSSPRVRAGNDAQRQAWMQGVTGTYGDPTGDISPDALSASRSRIGSVMDDVASRNNIFADPVQSRIGDIIHEAQGVLSDDQVSPLLKQAQRIEDVRSGDVIPGEAYQRLTAKGAPLDRLQNSADPNVSFYAGQIRDALDDGLEGSASPEDVGAFQNARWQYKNLMTVARAAPRAGPDGVLPLGSLQSAVGSNFKNQAFQGAGDLGELLQIRNAFMKEPPTSGTSERLRDLTSGLGIGFGAGGAAELGGLLLHQPGNALGPLAATATGYAAKAGAGALKDSRIAGPATGIIQRSLSGAPGTNALTGLQTAAQRVEVPLSALAGVRLAPPLQPIGSNAQ